MTNSLIDIIINSKFNNVNITGGYSSEIHFIDILNNSKQKIKYIIFNSNNLKIYKDKYYELIHSITCSVNKLTEHIFEKYKHLIVKFHNNEIFINSIINIITSITIEKIHQVIKKLDLKKKCKYYN